MGDRFTLFCMQLFHSAISSGTKNHLLKKYGKIPSNHLIIQRWFFTLVSIQVLIAGTSLGHMITLYTLPFNLFGISFTDLFSETHFFRICGGGFFIQNFFLFLFPNILYGNISYSIELSNSSTFEKLKSTFAKPIQINKHAFEQLIKPYLENHPFIHPDFTLSQMSFDLKISERNLSAYFNNDLHKTFGEWKNDLRIAYVVELIEGGQANKFTIEALATNAGFLSRSKFIDAFKQRQGLTPSAYIKSKKLPTN